VQIIECDHRHADAILTIFNEAIVNSTALYDYQPRTPATMTTWFETRCRGGFPIIGAVSDDDPSELLGFASYGPFRNFPAYKYTIEHSLYVAAPYRRRGVGKRLLTELIDRAQEQQYHAMIGAIDSANAASIALHERFGFRPAGTLPQVGFKFGRWLDLCFYQLLLSTPERPIDG
jgi:phosphinothricin acetyltransferase